MVPNKAVSSKDRGGSHSTAALESKLERTIRRRVNNQGRRNRAGFRNRAGRWIYRNETVDRNTPRPLVPTYTSPGTLPLPASLPLSTVPKP